MPAAQNGSANGRIPASNGSLKTQDVGTVIDTQRWEGVIRPYTPQDVARLQGSVIIEHTLAKRGAERLWSLMHEMPYVHSLGAMTGNQAMQQVRAGLPAIYCSGWQVAGDANTAGQVYPDQSLYPANAVPELVKRLNRALQRADQVTSLLVFTFCLDFHDVCPMCCPAIMLWIPCEASLGSEASVPAYAICSTPIKIDAFAGRWFNCGICSLIIAFVCCRSRSLRVVPSVTGLHLLLLMLRQALEGP